MLDGSLWPLDKQANRRPIFVSAEFRIPWPLATRCGTNRLNRYSRYLKPSPEPRVTGFWNSLSPPGPSVMFASARRPLSDLFAECVACVCNEEAVRLARLPEEGSCVFKNFGGRPHRRVGNRVANCGKSRPPKQRSSTCETAWVTSTSEDKPRAVCRNDDTRDCHFSVAASQIDSMRVGPKQFVVDRQRAQDTPTCALWD